MGTVWPCNQANAQGWLDSSEIPKSYGSGTLHHDDMVMCGDAVNRKSITEGHRGAAAAAEGANSETEDSRGAPEAEELYAESRGAALESEEQRQE
jgi:hypothetical protein